MTAWLYALLAAVPSAIVGFVVWLMQRSINKRDKLRAEAEAEKERKAEEKEKHREELDLMILRSVNASIALGEATARAVQRIPDAHCNGDMHAALDYAAKIKHEQKDFLTKLGVHALHED